MFGVVYGLDDILVVAREVEEAAALTRRAQLGENVFAGEGDEIVCRIQSEFRPEMSKYPRRIILEFEVVLR